MKVVKTGYKYDVKWELIEKGVKSFVLLTYTDNKETIRAKIWKIGQKWTGWWWRKDRKRKPLKANVFNEIVNEFKSYIRSDNYKTRFMIKDINEDQMPLLSLFRDKLKLLEDTKG